MSQLFLISMSTMNTLMFTKMKHPMTMGVLLLMQTVVVCLMTNGISQNSWFSYILFLVFLGGMLVLFIYMTSVASNEMFSTNKMMLLLPLVMIVTMMVLFIVMDPLLLTNNSEDTIMSQSKSMKYSSLTSMFIQPNNIITVLAVIYLFLTLIVVVKITEFNKGPLRSKI